MVSLKAITARRWLGLLAPAACLLALGCSRGRQMETDLYQRELRLQEDEIYRLEDYIEEYQALLRGARCQIADLQRELAETQRSEPLPSPPVAPATRPAPEPETSLLDRPEPDGAEALLPEIETPSLPATPAAPAFDAAPPEEVAPPFEAAPLFEGAATQPINQQPVVAPATAARPIEPPAPFPHAVQPRPLVSGVDSTLEVSATPGDEGTLLVTLRDRNGDPLTATANEASVMLTDPAFDGRLRRVARWDYDADEVAEATLSGSVDRVEFVLALPATAPRDEPLRIWVRLTDESGAKRLQSTEVRLAGESGPSGGVAWRSPPPKADLRILPATHEAPVE